MKLANLEVSNTMRLICII